MGELQPIRVTEYVISDFTGTTYDLVLDEVLSPHYYAIVQLTSDSASSTGPDNRLARVTHDPFGTGDLSESGGPKTIRLTRAQSDITLRGVIKVIECVGSPDVDGFRLVDWREVTVPGASSGTQTVTSEATGKWVDASQCVPFGGLQGAGVTCDESADSNYSLCSARLQVSGTGTITVTRRMPVVGGPVADAVYSVPVIQWGSAWTVQRAAIEESSPNFGTSYASTFWNVASLDASVVAEQTFTWSSGYTHSTSDHLYGLGIVGVLGPGTGLASITESSVAARTADDPGQLYVDVYVLSHPDMAVEHGRGSFGISATEATDAVGGPDSDEGRNATTTRTFGHRLAHMTVTWGYGANVGDSNNNALAQLTDTFELTLSRVVNANAGALYHYEVVDFGAIDMSPIAVDAIDYADFGISQADAQIVHAGNYARRARALLPAQFRDLPGWIAWTKAVGAVFQALEDNAFSAIVDRHLTTATGVHLRRWGRLVGEQQLNLTASEFRRVIRAKILALRSKGDADTLVRVYAVLMNTDDVFVTSYTKHLRLEARRELALSDAMASRVPKVMGTARKPGEGVTLVEALPGPLGFDENPNALGLGAGLLGRTL